MYYQVFPLLLKSKGSFQHRGQIAQPHHNNPIYRFLPRRCRAEKQGLLHQLLICPISLRYLLYKADGGHGFQTKSKKAGHPLYSQRMIRNPDILAHLDYAHNRQVGTFLGPSLSWHGRSHTLVRLTVLHNWEIFYSRTPSNEPPPLADEAIGR